MLLLANVLLVMVIVNASDAFDAMDRVGEAAESLETGCRYDRYPRRRAWRRRGASYRQDRERR